MNQLPSNAELEMKTEKPFPQRKKNNLQWSRRVTRTMKKKLFYYECNHTKQTFLHFIASKLFTEEMLCGTGFGA